MKINLKGTEVVLTADLQAYVYKKLAAIERLVPETALARVELASTSKHHKKGEVFRAEIQLSADGERYFAEENATSLKIAIDIVKDEIIREIKTARGKTKAKADRAGRNAKSSLRS